MIRGTNVSQAVRWHRLREGALFVRVEHIFPPVFLRSRAHVNSTKCSYCPIVAHIFILTKLLSRTQSNFSYHATSTLVFFLSFLFSFLRFALVK